MSFDLLQEMLPKWPIAIDKELICDPSNEEHKADRGSSITAFFIADNLAGKKFLDFGCGEGHVVKSAQARGAALSMGYDIVPQGKFEWDQDYGDLFTNWEIVKECGPYDVVLLYDVIDHAKNPEEVMNRLRSVTTPQSSVFVLTHPWCSRHGGHLYHNFNYAFAHIIFTEDELKSLGAWKDHGVQPVVNPINKYKAWFGSHFSITRTEITKDPVEDFFKQSLIKDRIIKRFNTLNPIFSDLPHFQMGQSFHEYVLKVKA